MAVSQSITRKSDVSKPAIACQSLDFKADFIATGRQTAPRSPREPRAKARRSSTIFGKFSSADPAKSATAGGICDLPYSDDVYL